MPDRRGVRFHELRDQVHAPHVDRVHADLSGEEVHRPFGCGSRLGPAGAAVGDGRRGVGDDTRGTALDVGDVVDRRDHRSGHRETEDATDVHEPARILEQVQLVVGDLALTGAADRHVLQLGATVTEVHHRLAAGLAPAHRASDRLRDRAEQHLLGVGADLRAERAADVGRDDTDLVGLDAVGRGDRRLDALGVLGGQPLVEATVDPRGRRATDLERARGDALVEEAARDDDLAILEVLVGVGVLGHTERRRVEHCVRSGVVVDQCFGRHRRFDVDQRREEVDVDEHHLGGVGGLRKCLRDDRNHGFADEADLVAGEQRARHGGVEVGRHRLERERFGGEDADDARHVLGPVDVDRQDRAVSDGRAGVHDMEGAGQQFLVEVVDVHAAGGEELGVLLALYSGPQDAAGHVCPLVLSVRAVCSCGVRRANDCEPSRQLRAQDQPCGRRRSA